MDFKIGTKDAFTTIMPLETAISAKLAEELHHQLSQMRQSGSKNFIIDLQQCGEMEPAAIDGLLSLHEECYSMEQSLVFTGINKEAMAMLKKEEAHLMLNIAPSMIEAVDIVSMEILERDLLSEE